MNNLITFDNGLRLVCNNNPYVRSVSVGIYVGAGAKNERPFESGVSHFVEHCVFKGTKTRSAFDIVNETERIGAMINAATSKTFTCFYTRSLDIHAEKCFEILCDMVLNPAFDNDELDKERQVVFEEIHESEDDPADVCYDNLCSAFFKGTPVSKPVLGTKKTLKTFDGDFLRTYMSERYVANNVVVSFSGNIETDECVRLVKKYLESGLSYKKLKDKKFETPKNRLAVAKKKNIMQSHFSLAFPAVNTFDDRKYAAHLLDEIFSAEMSSRLFQNVREKLGLCYSIGGSFTTYDDMGVYSIFTSTSPSGAEKAVKAIREEIDKLLADGVTDEELDRAKQQMKTAIVLSQENTLSIMRSNANSMLLVGEPYDIDEKLKLYDAVTKEDILSVANDIFIVDDVTTSLVSKDVSPDIRQILING